MTRLLLLVLVALLPDTSLAHRFAPSLLQLSAMNEETYRVLWKTPAATGADGPLRPQWPAHCGVSGEYRRANEGTGIVMTYPLTCDGPLTGTRIRVAGLAGNRSSALLLLDSAGGHRHQVLLNAESPAFVVPETASTGAVLLSYGWLGATHIWGGADHLLFVLGLLLLVGYRRQLLWTVTAFTVGHSITLSLVTLGQVDYPVSLVEFLIALSVLGLAVELSRGSDGGVLSSVPWLLAGAFGLLHGMGFAGALAEIGLPPTAVPMALASFNLGIEFGQLLFIGALFVLRCFLRHVPGSLLTRGRALPVYALGSLSALWCIERATALPWWPGSAGLG